MSYIDYLQNEFQLLHQYLQNCSNNSSELEKILIDVQKASNNWCIYLKKISERLHEHVSKGTGEDDSIECIQQYLSNFLLQISQQWTIIAEKLQSEIIEPFQMLTNNFKNVNLKIVQGAKDELKKIQQLGKQIKDQQDEYHKLMSNADKCFYLVERAVDQVSKGQKSKDELIKASEKQIKLKELAIETQEHYKKLVEKGNRRQNEFLEYIKEQYYQLGLNTDNRFKFTKQIILQLIKTVSNEEIYCLYQEKLSYLNQDQKVSDLQYQIQKALKKNGVQIIGPSKFEFQQYERLPSKDLHIDWTIVGDSYEEDEPKFINEYLEQFINEEQDLDRSFDSARNRKRTHSSSSSKSNYNLNQDYQKMKQLLQKQTSRMEFLSKLMQMTTFKKQLLLDEDQFNELVSLFKHLFMLIDINESEVEELYSFIQISTQIKRQHTILLEEMGQIQIWTSKQKWFQIYQFLMKKSKNNKQNQSDGSLWLLKKGIGYVGKGIKKITQQFNQIGEQEKLQSYKFINLDEICYYISTLNISPQIGTDIVFALIQSDEIRLDKQQITILIQKLEDSNVHQNSQEFISKRTIYKKKNEKIKKLGLENLKFKLCFILRQVINFLHPNDKPEKFLLVCRYYNNHLRRPIQKYHLMYRNVLYCEKNKNIRLQNLINFFRIRQDKLNYALEKSEAGQEIGEYEEIITMDVQRSFHLHFDKIPSSKLQSLLRTYAYYNKEIGYCQGMNYIAGYLYINFQDEEVAYEIFNSVMRNSFEYYFKQDFEMMKQVFYTHNRILSIFMPQLYHHFKQQKIDPSYYITSWFMTVYSQVYQFHYESALLNIIWDMFMLQSWKGFYKCTLFLLDFFKRQFYELEFEQILHFASDIIKNEIFSFIQEEELLMYLSLSLHIKQPVSMKIYINKKYKVTNQLLKILDNEHECFSTQLNKRIKEYYK
ncbi:hypothetical protein pb186bvf_011315 [Paramecium bursaria]